MGPRMTGRRICSTEGPARVHDASQTSAPHPALPCPPTPSEGSAQASHQFGLSGKWQAPHYGQTGCSQSPHSWCQAPGPVVTLTRAQGPVPVAGWLHLQEGAPRCSWTSYTQSSPGQRPWPHSLTMKVPPGHTVASGTWHAPPGHQDAMGCGVLDGQLWPLQGSWGRAHGD